MGMVELIEPPCIKIRGAGKICYVFGLLFSFENIYFTVYCYLNY